MPVTIYATVNDMINRFDKRLYQLLEVTYGSNISSNATLLAALSDANSEVDGYVKTRFTIALPSIPESLTRAACQLALWHVAQKRHEVLGPEDERNLEHVEGFLKAIARGDVTLGIISSTEVPLSGESDSVQMGTAQSLKDDGVSSTQTESWWKGY
jgi:phage gp36-like protein